MYDLLTEQEDKLAADRGWSLEYVFDCKANRLVVVPLPTHFTPTIPNTAALARVLVDHARSGDKLSIRALQLTMRGPETKARKKK